MYPSNQFVIRRTQGFGGNFTDSHYLGEAYQVNPHIFKGIQATIFASKDGYFNSKSFLPLISKNKITIDNFIYRWKMMNSDYRRARVVENLEASNTAPGLNRTRFKVKLDVDYYQKPDVLTGENNDFPVEIIEGPTQDGSGYIYVLELQSTDPTSFFPPELLEVGKEFCKVSTSVANEYNQHYGTQQHGGTIELEAEIGFFAEKHTFTDRTWQISDRLELDIPGKDGKKVTSYVPYAEAKVYEKFWMDQEWAAVLGKRGRKLDPETGYTKTTGAGVRQQMANGFNVYYNGVISTTDFRNWISDIFYSRMDVSERDIRFMTGQVGSEAFHDALASTSSSYLTVDNHWIRSASNPGITGKTPGLAFGSQFVQYNGPAGIQITLELNKMYDDKTFCPQEHPLKPGKTIDSGRFTCMDLGKSEGQANISMLEEANSYRWGYTQNMFSASGPAKGLVQSLKNGWDMAVQGSMGVWIKDHTRCAEMIMDVA